MAVLKPIEVLKHRMLTGEIFRRIRAKKLVEFLNLRTYELEELQPFSAESEPVESPIAVDHFCALPLLSMIARGVHSLRVRHRLHTMFEHCHIENAKCYPKVSFVRATRQFSQEIMAFRRQPKKVPVLYCDYGQTSREAAQQFAE
jgi:rhodanese-related sulfurtransferase